MTNQQILEKAIQKAIDGGWLSDSKFDKTKDFYIHWGQYPEEDYVCVKQTYHYGGVNSYEELIFDHDFAKALWGEEEEAEVITRWHRQSNTKDDWIGPLVPKWQYHLQNMVIAEDPIRYLGDNL